MQQTLEDLLKDQIRELYSAETQLIKALPRMVKAARHPELTRALEGYVGHTTLHAERVEQIATELGIKPTGRPCRAMEGLIADALQAMARCGTPDSRDASIITALQRCEHYKIASYGAARALAEPRALEDVWRLLDTNLDEEKEADEQLTSIAMVHILPVLADTASDSSSSTR